MESWILEILNHDGELVEFYPYLSKPSYYIECWLICKPYPKRLVAGSDGAINIKLIGKESVAVENYETITKTGLNKLVFNDASELNFFNYNTIEKNSSWLEDEEILTTSTLDRKIYANNCYSQNFDYNLIDYLDIFIVSPVIISQSGFDLLMEQEEPQEGAVIHYEVAYFLPINYVAFYKFDDNLSSTAIVDETANFNGVSVRDTNLMSTTGIITRALNFNGTSDYIELPKIFTSKTGSISLWINPSSMTEGRIIGYNDITLGMYFRLVLYSDRIDFILLTTAGNATASYPLSNISNTWNHLCVRFEENNAIGLFVNANNPKTASAGVFNPALTDLRKIGSSRTGSVFFSGTIDHVKFYDTFLVFNEVKALYQEGYPVSNPTIFSPVYNPLSPPQVPADVPVGSTVIANATVGEQWADPTTYEAI